MTWPKLVKVVAKKLISSLLGATNMVASSVYIERCGLLELSHLVYGDAFAWWPCKGYMMKRNHY
jgi:hypothetical protein